MIAKFRKSIALIKQHGDDARVHAAQMADKMLDKGDLDGLEVWLRILRANDELLSIDAGTVH